jgi:hypothetical protein
MPSSELGTEYRELHSYIIKRIVDYGAMVADEEDDRDPEKHGNVIAEIVMDIIDKVQNFSLHVFQEQMNKR